MKKKFWILFLVLTLALAACGKATTPTPPSSTAATAAPKTGLVSLGGVVASAKIVPAHKAQMSFVISAPVKEVLVKEGDAVKAGQPLIVLNTPDLELSVAEAQFAATSAQLQVDRAYDPYKKRLENGKIVYVIGYRERRQEVEAKLLYAQAALNEAKFTLAQGTLIAPFDGTIAQISIGTGEVTQPGKVVLVIGDTANMQIETTDLSERDVANVKIGQKATVYVKPLDKHMTGKVTSISPISELVGGDVVYKVIIALDEQIDGLLWGMSSEVEILTQ